VAERLVHRTGFAELLGLTEQQLVDLRRRAPFPQPLGDGGSFWREADVFEWAAALGQPLAAVAPLRHWPVAHEPAEFLGAVRAPQRYGRDDVVLRWATASGTVGVVWRPDHASMLRFDDVDPVSADALVNVDADFGAFGPWLRSRTRGRGGEDVVSWPQLANILGQPVPYWPYVLRDPDLIEAWNPGAPVVIAPAQTDLDVGPLLRMAAMFEPEHATHQTLTNLVRVTQDRATRDAVDDLESAASSTRRWTAREPRPILIDAARPLVIGELDADEDDVNATVRRIGWMELLGRTDTLSWTCVRQVLAWDGGRHFPFSSPQEVDPTTPEGREWIGRLEPTKARTAAFACMDNSDIGKALVDPLTDAPVIRKSDGQVLTVVPQRLPATSPLSEVILNGPIWIRTADGTVYPAPRLRTGLTWGYDGTGPAVLASLIHRLLDDINAAAVDYSPGSPAGLERLTTLEWPIGVVLPRELLEAAREGRPFRHPEKPQHA
jgi:hypothetical protein